MGDTEITDLHMAVLAAFEDDTVNTVHDVMQVLDADAALIRQLVRDLEAAGLIEACALH
jgi:predicted transcriptional regulator